MYQPSKRLVKKKPQPSPLKKEQMKRDLGFDDFELSFSSDFSSDESHENEFTMKAMTKELNRINETKSNMAIKNVELQREVKVLKEKLEKETKSKKARLGMVQKACSDAIDDKKNVILDLQEMLEDKFDSAELNLLLIRIESLHEDKASLHKQLINAQIEYEERIQEEIFSKCQYCKIREENKNNEDSAEIESLNREITNLSNTGVMQSAEIESLRSEIPSLNNCIAVQKAKIESLSKEVTSLNNSGVIQKDKIESLSKEVTSLNNSGAIQKDKIESLLKEIKSLNNSGAEQKAKIESLSKEVTSLNNSGVIQKDKIESLSKEVTSLNNSGVIQKDKIESLLKEIKSLNNSGAEQKAKIESLNKEVSSKSNSGDFQKAKIESLNKEISGLQNLVQEKEKCLKDVREDLNEALKSNEAESLKLKMELSTKEKEKKDLSELFDGVRRKLDEKNKLYDEQNLKEKATREEYKQKIEQLESDKLSLKRRVEKVSLDMSREMQKSEQRYNDLQATCSAERRRLSLMLENEQAERIGLKQEQMQDSEKTTQLMSEYDQACVTIEELKNLVATREKEAEDLISATRIELEKRVQQATSEYELMKVKYSQLEQTSSSNMSSLTQQVDLIKCESLDKIMTQQSEIENLGLRLCSSEEKLEEFTKLTQASKQDLKHKEIEVNKLMGSLKDTNEKFVRQNERIADLEEEVGFKETVIENLKLKITEMKNESDIRTNKMAQLEDKLRSTISSNNEQAKILQERLNSTETSLRFSIEERENMDNRLKDNHIQIENLKDEIDRVIRNSDEKIAEIQRKTLEQLEQSQSECNTLSQHLQDKDRLIKRILPNALMEIHELRVDMDDVRIQVKQMPSAAEEFSKETMYQIRKQLDNTNELYRKMLNRYRKEMQMRKKLHNELIELRGNIRVFVRVRPRIIEDSQSNPLMAEVVSYDANDDSIIYVSNHRGKNLKYEVDKVFTANSTQQELYKEVKSLVTSCMDGYNVCIFAYGQTGSGKTYTMEGTTEHPGINQRALFDLFAIMEQRSHQWDYQVTVSLLEIYNESLRDLLNCSSEKLDIRMNPDGTLKVSQLVARTVTNLNDVNQLFDTGRKNRATACTNMNEHSSRSHAVLVINIEGASKTDERKVFGRLNLIDLAGSERVSKSGAAGDRLKEAQNINRSLSALGDVIQALRNKQPHIPFRNSKLTYLLQDSLSKDSKTLMVVQVAPNASSTSETICSLSFAQRVRAVELGMANKKVNK